MYRVMLADDEPSVTDAMRERIDWAHFNMEVAWVVQSGKEAMDIVRENAPDVAILDIRMPGYSGLEIAKYIFENKIKTRIIILSGYAEFSYAQKAMQYEVIGYCLKPVEYDEINQFLHKAIQLFENKPSKVTSDEFFEAIETNDLKKLSSYLSDHNFEYDSFYLALSRGEKVNLPSASLSFTAENTFFGYLSGTPFSDSEIKEALNTKGLEGFSFANETLDVASFRGGFHHLLALTYQSFIEPGTVLACKYTDFRQIPFVSSIKEAASFGEAKKLSDLLVKYKDPDLRSTFNVHTAQQLFNLVVNSDKFFDTAGDYYIHNYRQLVHDYASFDEMIDALVSIIGETNDLYEPKAELSNFYFLKIMKYLNTYYKENITLQDIAAVVNLNPNYVSQMFKKTTGSNFSYYLTNLRITNAKKMLTETDVSISKVAADSGFNDYFYFLKTFKKHTGLTPSEFRNQGLS